MTDYKPLIYSLAIIFMIGLTINLTLDLVNIDLESETEGTYISPFVTTTGVLIDVVVIPITFIGDIFSSIFNLFTSKTPLEDNYLIVEGTGTQDSFTLDGSYFWIAPDLFRSATESKNIINFERNEDDEVINATIESSEFTFWWFTHKVIYVVDDISSYPTMTFNLIATEYDFNPTSTLTVVFDEELIENPPFNVQLKNFFNDVKEYAQNQVRTFGLIPSIIGLPLILLILISLFYGIYKIIRP